MTNNTRPLLPDFLKKPIMLLWAVIAPQALLFLHNCRLFWLVNAEASPENLSLFGITFAAQVSLLALASGALFSSSSRKQKSFIRWPWFLTLLIGQIGYLWFFTANSWRMIPANVDRWIVNEGTVSLYAFTLLMPGIFYSGIQLACFKLPISKAKDFGLSILLTIVAPAIFYLFFIGTTLMLRERSEFFYRFLWPFFFVVLTVLMFTGLIRLMALLYNWISERGSLGQMVFVILIGIAAPIGGLALNRFIPFPADFQSLAVYVMAIINGTIVLLPCSKKYSAGLLFLRSATYSFTLYFFLVFLPFLPAALIAIFALGLGFLIFVPVLLFVLHTKKLADDFKICAAGIGAKIPVLLVILGISILPAYFLWQAISDKWAVNEALQYTYSPDYQSEQNFKGNLKAARRAILNLRNFKDGLQLPYISDAYNRIVFEGMVLPDEKITQMFYLFTGEDIKNFTRGKFGLLGREGGFFGARRARSGVWLNAPPRRIDRNVSLEAIESQFIDAGSSGRIKARLTMRNAGASNEAEFLTNINIPQGVVVTAFRLKVGEEMAAAKIFERRAAQWVYHMIRDFVRRDPGVLVYKNSGQLELRIYPFALNETREAEIEFEFPANFSPVISISAKPSEPLRFLAATGEIMCAQDSRGNAFLFVPEAQLKKLPAISREPYFYFVLDRSRNGLEDLTGYLSYIEAIARQYPEVKYCRVTAANFSLSAAGGLTGDFIDVNQRDILAQALRQITLPRQGGFDLERAVKQELLRYAQALRGPKSDRDWQSYPVFVAVTPDKSKIGAINDLDFYREIIPESGHYFIVSSRQNIEKQFLWAEELPAPAEVVIFAQGRQRAAVPLNSAQSAVVYFPASGGDGQLAQDFSVFDAPQKKFASLGAINKFSYPYEFIDKISLLQQDSQIILNPSRKETALPQLVDKSRQLSVLIPSTSFMVVERGVQWKALQLAEKKRLAAQAAFEFEEDFKTPAPPLWMLLAFLIVLAAIKGKHGRFSK